MKQEQYDAFIDAWGDLMVSVPMLSTNATEYEKTVMSNVGFWLDCILDSIEDLAHKSGLKVKTNER